MTAAIDRTAALLSPAYQPPDPTPNERLLSGDNSPDMLIHSPTSDSAEPIFVPSPTMEEQFRDRCQQAVNYFTPEVIPIVVARLAQQQTRTTNEDWANELERVETLDLLASRI